MKAVIKRQDIPGLVIIALIGIGLTFLGTVKLKNAARSRNWPVTTGTIIRSEVGGAIKYYPSILYTYTLDNAIYTSTGISNVNFNTKKRKVAEDFIKKYPTGSKVKVFYNSEDPSKALLEPGINTGHILLLAFGIFLTALPIIFVSIMKVEWNRTP
jgi:hypothetical protein